MDGIISNDPVEKYFFKYQHSCLCLDTQVFQELP